MKLDILAISVHPDDAELSCSGTLIKHIRAGHKVGVLDLTHGELGTRGTPEIRRKEAEQASVIMGISIRENVGIPDGLFELDSANKLKIIPFIRKYRPDIVLCNAIEDRHPDHGRAAKLAADACFLAGLRKIKTKDNGITQEAWRPRAIYHYIQEKQLFPDVVVDISDTIDQKIESILAFQSQFFNPESNEPETPISSKSYVEFVKAKARVFGNLIGVEFGEGFNVIRPVGLDNLLMLK